MRKQTLASLAILSGFLFGLPSMGAAQTPSDEIKPRPLECNPDELTRAYQESNWYYAADMGEACQKAYGSEDIKIGSILGIALAQTDRNEKAEEVFLKLSASHPDDPQTFGNLCYVQNALKREQAVDTCVKAAELNPEKSEFQYLAGQLLESSHRVADAREYYIKAWRMKDLEPMYLTAATSLDFAEENYQAAYDLTKEAIDKGVSYPILYLNLLVATNGLGKYEETLEIADKGYEKYKDEGMRLSKAEALYHLGRYEEAQKLIEEIEPQFNPDSVYYPRIELLYGQLLLIHSCECYMTKDSCCDQAMNALKKLSAATQHPVSRKKRNAELNLYYHLAFGLHSFAEPAPDSLKTDPENYDAILLHALWNYRILQEEIHREELKEKHHKENPERYEGASPAQAKYINGMKKRVNEEFRKILNLQPGFSDVENFRKTHPWPEVYIERLKMMLSDPEMTTPIADDSKSGDAEGTISTFFIAAIGGLIFIVFLVIIIIYIKILKTTRSSKNSEQQS